jgi:hypothetical protein
MSLEQSQQAGLSACVRESDLVAHIQPDKIPLELPIFRAMKQDYGVL